eukprot:5776140-Amphidinium_carterae.1
MSDMREIDNAEALRVWSELSELDPRIRGEQYVTDDGSQRNFSDLKKDERESRSRRGERYFSHLRWRSEKRGSRRDERYFSRPGREARSRGANGGWHRQEESSRGRS